MNYLAAIALLAAALTCVCAALFVTAARTTRHQHRVVFSHDMSCGVFILLGLAVTADFAALLLAVVIYFGEMS